MKLVLAHLRSRLLVAALGVALVAGYVSFPSLLLDDVEHYLYDSLIGLSPPIASEARVVIVDIDERSLATYGPWPWPRATVAQMVDRLVDRHQVALLGLDIVFPASRGDEHLLQRSLDRPNVVMSQILDFEPDSPNRVGVLFGSVSVIESIFAPPAAGFIGNGENLLPPQAGVGHISPLIDDDGRIRRLYPVACYFDVCSLTLALRMYAQLSAGNLTFMHARFTEQGRQLRVLLEDGDAIDLPLDGQQAMIIPYRVASGGFRVVSAADVLDDIRALPVLDNSIVLVGSSALGIGDRVATPLDKITPGVEVHAQLLTALLDQSFIRTLPPSSVDFLLLAALVLLSWLLWPAQGRYQLLAWPVATLVALGAWLVWQLLGRGVWLPLSPLPVMVVAMTGMGLLAQSFTLNERLRNIGSQFSRFLPATLVGQLLRDRAVGPDTERHMMTVLIVDVRGFTAASEGKTPEQIAAFAQKCFEVLSAQVARYHGTIEKYTGDGLMALWGVPTDGGEVSPATSHDSPLHVRPVSTIAHAGIYLAHARYAAQAVSAAIEMQRAVNDLSAWFSEHGYGDLQLSIGLNTGLMSVGVFGGQSHLAWSAQGQAFNVASRIENLTRTLGESPLLGEQTARLLDPDDVRMLGEQTVKGVSAPVVVYGLNNKND